MTDTDVAWRSRFASDTIQWAEPDQLLANPMNARRHPGDQREALIESLDKLGWVAPCTVNVRTNRLVDGHARVEEAITAGAPLVPFLEIDVSEDEERRILASLDPIGALAIFDAEVLAGLTDGIEFEAPALAELLERESKFSPYSDDELSDMFGRPKPESGEGGEESGYADIDNVTVCFSVSTAAREVLARWLQHERLQRGSDTMADALVAIAREGAPDVDDE